METGGINKDSVKHLSFHAYMHDSKRSALRKYQDLVLGERSWLRLLYYELVTVLLANLPGLVGLFLRQRLYRPLLAHMGKGVVIGMGASLRQPGKIALHRSCVVEDLVSIAVRGGDGAGITIGEGVFIGRGTMIKTREGRVHIDTNTTISSNCRIATAGGTVRIGRDAQIGAYCYIGGGDHRTTSMDVPMAMQGSECRGGVTIEDDVWIGAHSFVKDGVTVGTGSIIGACSFVNRDIPAYSVAFGCPARVRKRREGCPESQTDTGDFYTTSIARRTV